MACGTGNSKESDSGVFSGQPWRSIIVSFIDHGGGRFKIARPLDIKGHIVKIKDFL